jgi:tRNA (guanosine-2'-O-)-methyltransferase
MPTLKRLEKIAAVITARQEGIVVLEDLYDPHNAAAILRTMDGFGFQTAYFIFDKQKKYNPKKVGKSSSSSANKWITCEIFPSTKDCYESLKKDGYTVLATALRHQNSLDLYTSELPQTPKIALVFGNEHSGLSPFATNHADAIVHLPMRGFVESFNVSVMAALVIGELSRRRIGWGMKQYLLPQEKRDTLEKVWLGA